MPRQPRKILEGKHFHVMVQGIGKEYVFPDDNCKGFYITCLLNNKRLYPVKILGFCVMGNHAHILVNVKDSIELSGYFKRVNSDYARYYNRIHKRVGYVFRDRFKSEMVTDERWLVYCLAYIHNNPLKAGMVRSAEEYKFSSLTNYIQGTGATDFKEAAKFYDISIGNIMAIMAERTDMTWLEHDDKEYEKEDEVYEELKKRYNITSTPTIELAIRFAREIRDRCGTSLRGISELLGIGRETLRSRLSKKE